MSKRDRVAAFGVTVPSSLFSRVLAVGPLSVIDNDLALLLAAESGAR